MPNSAVVTYSNELPDSLKCKGTLTDIEGFCQMHTFEMPHRIIPSRSYSRLMRPHLKVKLLKKIKK